MKVCFRSMSVRRVDHIPQSAWLSEALSELDNSCDKLTIICSPPTEPLPLTSTGTTTSEIRAAKGGAPRDHGARPTFRLLGVSAYGSTEIDYPNDRDVLQSFECEERTQFRCGACPRSFTATESKIPATGFHIFQGLYGRCTVLFERPSE